MSTLEKIIVAQKELLELLITCESEVANLYETYSRCIPERSAFWVVWRKKSVNTPYCLRKVEVSLRTVKSSAALDRSILKRPQK